MTFSPPVIDSTRTVMEASKELLDATFDNTTRALQIDSMYPEQRTACEYILNGRDVFVTFPMGFGKSIVYRCLPSVMKFLRTCGMDFPANPVVLVVCPLKSLMDDQVSTLRKKGVSATVSQRFSKPRTLAPGPGTYSVSKSTDWLKHTHSTPSSPPKTRLQYQRQKAAPSIPTPGQSYGYEEDSEGVLRAQDAAPQDKTMGPAYYNVSYDDTEACKKYRGVHFGNLTSQRIKFEGKLGPGPGDYNVHVQNTEDSETTAARQNKKFESKLPRYHELVVQQETKKAIPGPGKYNITGQFDEHLDPDVDFPERAPFGSLSKRFASPKDNTPAPGIYNDPRTALEITKRTTGLKHSPFGQTSARFKPRHHIRQTPGPCAYNSEQASSISGQLSRKAIASSTRKGGFGTTAVRTAPLTKRNESEIPGPAHYIVNKNSPKSQTLSSTFASMTSRLASPPAVQQDVPPPGSYEVSQSYDSSHGKGYSSQVLPSSLRASFGLTAGRFDPPRSVLIFGKTDEDNPGPGQYETQLHNATGFDTRGGLMVTRDQRFKEVGKDIPGPGAYKLSPLQQHSVLQGTFNVTLNNPVSDSQVWQYNHSSGPHSRQTFMLGV